MIASAIPLAWALVRSARRRRVDASSLVVVAYAAAVVLSVLLGGSALTFKLRDVAALAAVGLACLVSLAFRRPLLLTALQIIVRHRNDADTLRRRLADPATQHDLGAATALTGTLFALAAATDGLLIATVSTATFLAVSGPLGGLAPLAAIAATIALLRHRSRRRSSNLLRPANPLPPTGRTSTVTDRRGRPQRRRHATPTSQPNQAGPDTPSLQKHIYVDTPGGLNAFAITFADRLPNPTDPPPETMLERYSRSGRGSQTPVPRRR
jgi:hypothetical protein